MSEVQNDQLILISGASASGKSMSLRDIKNPEKWFYLNCENKRLPFKSKFQDYRITDCYQVHEGLDAAAENKDIEGVIIDTLTFLMDQVENQYVLTASNTMKAWGDFAKFYKDMMGKVALCNKPVIMLAHTRTDLDEQTMSQVTAVPIKGSLKNEGCEAWFSTVVSTKVVSIKELEEYKNDLLTITEEEAELGFKHVFQTRLTKKTIGERIRSPFGMFSKSQTYIDNDAQALLDYLNDYYKTGETQ